MLNDVGGGLRVQVLGPLRAWADGRELPLGSNRQQAVLAVLAAQANQVVSQRALIAGVWGGSAPASATGNLHTYLSGLRRALGPARDVLVSDPDGYVLRLDHGALDSAVFEATRLEAEQRHAAGDRAGAVELLNRALGLWSGEFCAGVRSPFIERTGHRLAGLRLDAARLRARLRLEVGEHAEAAAELTDLVRRRPLDESLRELLMLALHGSGRHAEALAVFRDARAALAEQGLEPGRALVELHRLVLSGRDEPVAGPSVLRVAPPRSAPLPSCGLVGRAAELAALTGALDDVLAGRGRAVWVEGEAGIGKTALLTAALDRAAARPCHLAWGTTDETSADFPLQVVLEAFDITPSSPDPRRAQLASQVRGLLAQRSWNRTAPVERLLGFVGELCAAAPMVLVLDGLQWADDASLLFFDRLVGATGHLPLLLVGASRPDRARHGTGRPRREVVASGGLLLTPLALDGADTERLVGAVVGASSGPGLRSLATISAGNPLYALEITGLMVRDGNVRVVDGVAEIEEGSSSDASYQLRSGVRKGLAHLSEDAREVLRSAALLGMSFDVGDLAAVTGRLPVRLLGPLDEAVQANLLVASDDLLAFRHPFVRWTLYRAVPQSLRVALHRQAAEALAAKGVPVERVVEHLAIDPSVVDSWVALWLVEHRDEVVERVPLPAVDLLRRVLASGLVEGADRTALGMVLLRALFRLGEDLRSEATEVLGGVVSPAEAAEARHLLALVRHRLGDQAEAVAVVESAVRAPGVPDVWRIRHHALLAYLRQDGAPSPAEADADAARVHAAAVAAGDACEAAYALRTRWWLATTRRDHDSALRHVDAALDLVRGRPELAEARYDLLDNRASTLTYLDRLVEARAALEEARADIALRGLPIGMQVPVAVLSYWTGDWERAVVELSGVGRDAPGLTFFGVRPPDPAARLMHGLSALIAVRRDEWANAAVHLDLAGVTGAGTAAEADGGDFLLVASALAAERRGGPEEAVRALSALLRGRGDPVVPRHQWLPLLVRSALDAGHEDVAVEAAELCAREAGREVPKAGATAAAAHCAALLARAPEALADVAAHYRSTGRVVELAGVLEDAGVLHAGRGERAEAAEVFAEANALYERLDARWDLRRAQQRLADAG
ncbi:BTAD domain-containing putative transcriptional regulator [Actinosynnema sp. CA-299493]